MKANDQTEAAFPAVEYGMMGMSMLQWYAGQALQGFIAQMAGERRDLIDQILTPESVAHVSFDIAEAMVQEYERRIGK